LWTFLESFWPEDRIEQWQSALYPRGIDGPGADTAINLITLSRDLHCYWNDGLFALKPISLSSDKRVLTIQFFWQVGHDTTSATIDVMSVPTSTRNVDCHKKIRIFDFRNPEDRRVTSGDIFELKTDDPVKRPLPDFSLLELQFFLQRIVGMAGAAEAVDIMGLDSSDDEAEENAVYDDDDEEIEDESDFDCVPELDRKLSSDPASQSPEPDLPRIPADASLILLGDKHDREVGRRLPVIQRITDRP